MSDTTLHTADQLRIDARKIIDAMSISLQQIIPRLSEAGDPDTAALNTFDAQIYLDKVTTLCNEILLAGVNMPSVEESKKALTGPNHKRRDLTQSLPGTDEPQGIGDQAKALLKDADLGKYQTVITRYARAKCVAANHSDAVFIEIVKACIAKIQANGNRMPFTETIESFMEVYIMPITETPAAVAAEPEVDTLSTKSDEEILAAVTKAGQELADVIEGEVIEDKPAEPVKPAQQGIGNIVTELWIEFLGDVKILRPELTDKEQAMTYVLESIGYAGQGMKQAVADIGSASIRKLWTDHKKEAQNSASKPPAAVTVPEIQISAPVTKSEPQSMPSMAVATITENRQVAQAPTFDTQMAFKMPTPFEFQYLQSMARSVAASKFYKGIDTEDKAMVVFMQAFTLDINPFSALQDIHVIPDKNGNLGLMYGAKLLKALVDKSKLMQRFDIKTTVTECEVTAQRKDRQEWSIYRYSIDDAQKANLLEKKNWQQAPKQMLSYRAISNAVKAECPEVMFSFIAAGAGVVDDEDTADEALALTA